MNRTGAVIAVFSAAAIGLACTLPQGGVMHTAEQSDREQQELNGVRLKDQADKEYTLTKNADGTETALYADGSSVRFVHAGVCGISYVSGSHGLLAGLAASYYAYRGLLGGEYHDDGQDGQVAVDETGLENAALNDGTGSHYVHVGAYGAGTTAVARAAAGGMQGPHSGFGSAGVRSAAS